MDKPMVECPFQVDSWSYGWTKYESGWDFRNFSASALASFQFWPVTTTSTSSACKKGFLGKVSCFLTRILIRKLPFEIVFCCYSCLNLLREKFFQVTTYLFSKFLGAENVVQVCDLFKTLFLLKRTGEKVMKTRKNFEYDTNLDNYSNRMYFSNFSSMFLNPNNFSNLNSNCSNY